MITPSWGETFRELHAASTVEELWDVLVSWHGIRSSSQWDEPYHLFHRFHAEDPTDAVVTAALLCTDHRWRKGLHRLVVQLVDVGVMEWRDTQQLAEWFVGDGLDIDVETPGLGGHPVAVRTVERPIWPALRRWAAGHLLEGDPGRWRDLLDTAEALPSNHGAALAAGTMDGASHIPLDQRRQALVEGLTWGSGVVRLAALPGLADIDGVDVALRQAADDPSAKVRAWTPHRSPPSSSPSTTRARPGASPIETDHQERLF